MLLKTLAAALLGRDQTRQSRRIGLRRCRPSKLLFGAMSSGRHAFRPAHFPTRACLAKKPLDGINTRVYRFLQIRVILVFIGKDASHVPAYPILIIGGGGKTGGRVNALPAGARHRHPPGFAHDHAIRSTGPARRPGPRPSTASPAAYVTYPARSRRGRRHRSHRANSAASPARRGSSSVVLLSGRGEPGAQRAEAALQIVRRAMDHRARKLVQPEFLAKAICSTACWRARSRCRPDAVPEPFIDVDDIADVVDAALTEGAPRQQAL